MADQPKPGVALALQGGGAHGAFTWGVLDRLLEDGLTPDAICGVSSGAIIGTMVAQGLVRGGQAGAGAEMRKFWCAISQAHAVSPLQSAPLERSTNSVEGFFGVFKRGMVGVYQHCGEQHFQRYLDEFTFRYNNRSKLGIEDTERAILAIKGAEGKRLMYEGPVSG